MANRTVLHSSLEEPYLHVNKAHDHDDRYYTQDEIDSFLGDITVAEATGSSSGVIRLAGDLSGQAVAPMVKNMARVYNIRDYGAKGDGTANDTAAVTAAIAALNASGGGILLLPQGGSYVLTPGIQISSNTHVINQGTVILDPAYVNSTTIFKGIFRVGSTSGTNVIQNVIIEGGLARGDCFTDPTFPSPTFNPNNHKYVCYVHSVSTLINCQFRDFRVTNMGSPITLEKLGGVSGTPSRNTHVFNLLEEQVWVGVQYYCNGYLFEDCSIHDIDVKYCYDDAVAICGGWGGVTGAAGLGQRIQVYNIRGEKSGQLGGMVKIDGGDLQSGANAPLTDIAIRNVTGYTNGVNESLVSLFKGGSASTKKISLSQLQAQGKWTYGLYAQTNGRSLSIDGFQFESLHGIHLQCNAVPNVYQSVRLMHGSCQSRNASLADTVEGGGVVFSAGTSIQGLQNVRVIDVELRNKAIPINEGPALPPGTGTQGTYRNFSYDIDVRNSSIGDCAFSSTNRRVRYAKEGIIQAEAGTITGDDIEVTDVNKGVILKSPDGNRWRVKVGNGGTLTTEAA